MPLSNPSTKHTDSELDIETLPEFTDYNNDLISIGNRDEFTFVVRYLGGRVVLKNDYLHRMGKLTRLNLINPI